MEQWNVWCPRKSGHLMLWRTEPDAFLVIQAGDLLPELLGHGYLLLHNKYQALLSNFTEQVEVFPVSILDRVLNVTHTHYVELRIKNTQPIPGRTGPQLWTDDDFPILRVCGEMRKLFEEVSTTDFEFNIPQGGIGG